MDRSRVDVRVDRDAHTPIATQLAHQIAWLIASGELDVGDELPAYRQLADDLGINLHTVRAGYRQLANDGMVDIQRGRRARVLAFNRSIARGSIADVPSYTMGLIIPEFSLFYGPLVRGIEEAARRQHSMVFICPVHNSEDVALRYLDRLVARQVDGIIIAAQLPPDVALPPPSLTAVVSVDVPNFPGPGVEFDLEGSQFSATRHLAEHGHRRIGYVTAPLHLSNVDPKMRGHLRALESAHIDPEEELIAEAIDFSVDAGERGAERLLDLAHPPRAIAASSDSLAFGAYRSISRRGLRIPDDIALVGNDGTEMASMIGPGLTTVALPIAEAGEIAVSQLTENPSPSESHPRRIILPTELVIRASCGCSPANR